MLAKRAVIQIRFVHVILPEHYQVMRNVFVIGFRAFTIRTFHLVLAGKCQVERQVFVEPQISHVLHVRRRYQGRAGLLERLCVVTVFARELYFFVSALIDITDKEHVRTIQAKLHGRD